MADFTLTDVQRFPEGTSVDAYPVSGWRDDLLPPTGDPLGSATDTQTMTAGTLTFTGLTAGVNYFAYAQVGSDDRYTLFTAAADQPILENVTEEATQRIAADEDEAAARAAADTALTAASTVITANTQIDSYTLALTDAGKCVEINHGSDKVLTVPKNSVIAFPTGTVIELHRYGAGAVTVAPVDGTVTIDSPGGLLDLASQFSSASLRKRATNEWVLSGDLA